MTHSVQSESSDSPVITCTKCQDEAYLKSDGTCVLCVSSNADFLRCNSPAEGQTAPVPTQCANNKALVNSACVTMLSNCQLFNSSNTQECKTCLAGFTLTASGCKTCSSPCTTCAPSDTETPPTDVKCTACPDPYYLNGTTCSSCGSNCTKCTSGTECTNCATNAFKTSTHSCTLCSSVVSNCVQCDGTADKCTACDVGYFKFTDSNKDYCKSCPSNCVTCDAKGQLCSLCSSGYLLYNSGCVSASEANCATIDPTKSTCTTCKYGYFMNSNSQCVRCLDPYGLGVCQTQTTGRRVLDDTTVPTGSSGKANTKLQPQPIDHLCNQGYYWTN